MFNERKRSKLFYPATFRHIIAWGIFPAFAPALVILCFLWLLGSNPIIALALAAVWLLRRLVADFSSPWSRALARGLRASGVFRPFRGGAGRDRPLR